MPDPGKAPGEGLDPESKIIIILGKARFRTNRWFVNTVALRSVIESSGLILRIGEWRDAIWGEFI